jgi:single-strand DNA-binding protein
MAAFEAEGKLYKKMDIQQVTDTFKKREFVVEMVDGAYTQLVKFQMVQNNCEKLDGFNEGDEVKVTFNLRGREWTSPQGEVKYFSTLDAWKIDSQTGTSVQQAALLALLQIYHHQLMLHQQHKVMTIYLFKKR